MNYLVHIFLSGADRKMQFGNFIGDAVKGSTYRNYPQTISDGILLHRAIDIFTDSHPAVKETVKALKPEFGRYSAVLLDIYFDYLLASRFEEFSEVPLRRFARRFYFTIIINGRWLPGSIKRFMWHFIGTNRLCKYAAISGISEALRIMVRVHRMDVSVDRAVEYLAEHEKELFAVFLPFFEELQLFCEDYIKNRAADVLSCGSVIGRK